MHGEVEVSSGGRLYFESEGEGHPVVLIHAGIVDRRMWDREFRTLAKRFWTVRYDVRGFGRSTPAHAPYSDSHDLELLLRHLDIDRPMLVGASSGGRIALDYAVGHRSQVEALVTVCSGLAGYEPGGNAEAVAAFDQLDQRLRSVDDLHRLHRVDEAIDALLDTWVPALPPETRAFVRTLVKENETGAFGEERLSVPVAPATATRVKELDMPTLIISGEKDPPAMQFISEYLFQQIPGAEFEEISGADHLPNLSQPAAFDRILGPFLE